MHKGQTSPVVLVLQTTHHHFSYTTTTHTSHCRPSAMTSSPSASTTSLVTVSDTATISSRAPLVPRKDTKDFSDAFSSLQSTYGFGAAPAPVARKTPKTRPPAPAPPVSPQPTGVPKDYQAAFGDLQSSFGFGMSTGPGPVPKSRPSRKHLAPAPAPAPAVVGPAPKPKAIPPQKDYAAAFGHLQSSFGFGESTGPHPVAKTAAVKDGGAPYAVLGETEGSRSARNAVPEKSTSFLSKLIRPSSKKS
ncbi:hypothetical protein HMN09_01338200 [Mycena chlorophos]|uniref:Uncharacterized protein n=1 Tax=Mycena chlorophos TaxID=658473 RepID=A0A8H6RY35_MYCCL|nr:hypothetical protein HMN09_01338200 [Mycena chlorophos]